MRATSPPSSLRRSTLQLSPAANTRALATLPRLPLRARPLALLPAPAAIASCPRRSVGGAFVLRRAGGLRRRRQRRWQRRRRRQRLLQPHTRPPNWTSDGSRTPGGEHPARAGEGGSARGSSWRGRGRPGRARGVRERGQLRAGHLRGLGARRSVEADSAEKYFFLLSV